MLKFQRLAFSLTLLLLLTAIPPQLFAQVEDTTRVTITINHPFFGLPSGYSIEDHYNYVIEVILDSPDKESEVIEVSGASLLHPEKASEEHPIRIHFDTTVDIPKDGSVRVVFTLLSSTGVVNETTYKVTN